MNRPFAILALAALPLSFAAAQTPGQQRMAINNPKPVINNEPTTPPAQHLHLLTSGISLDIPTGWSFSRYDGELSTFALDARSSLSSTRMRGVAALNFNPFPYSTFSGAFFYSSTTPKSSALQCSNQATAPASHPVTTTEIDGVPFKHGYAEHGRSCTEERDEVYTALRGSTCFRFDLVINTFCGGEVSGTRDITERELEAVRHRLEAILTSVKFDAR
jgi:hypothetical protein